MLEIKHIKVGVVGCGAIAQIMHIPNLTDLNEIFELKAICDISPQLVNSIAQKYGIDPSSSFTDYTSFLKADIDAVFVLTGGSHAPFVLEALKAGKHVFCEKPLCFTLKEAEEIEQVLMQTSKTLMIGYMKRYDPGFNYALKQVQQIENPRYTQVTVLHPSEQQYFDMHGVLHFDDIPKNLKEVAAIEQDLLIIQAVGSISESLKYVYQDALLSSLVHNINCIRATFGKPLGVLSTHIWPIDSCYPTINTVLDYGESHRIALTWSYLSEVRNYVEEFCVYSDTERVKAKFSSPFLKNTPTVVSREYMKDGNYISDDVQVSFDNAFKRELIVFHECITKGKPVETNLIDAKEDIEILQSILAAYQPVGLGGEAFTHFASYRRAA